MEYLTAALLKLTINKMKAVNALKDDSGHWYLIPNELVEEFNSLCEKADNGDEDACTEVDSKFGKYRTGGDLNTEQLYVIDEEADVFYNTLPNICQNTLNTDRCHNMNICKMCFSAANNFKPQSNN